MDVYLVWYYNPELNDSIPALWGLYTTKEKAEKRLKNVGFMAG